MSRAKRRKSAKNLTQLYLKGLEFEFGFWLKPKKNKKKTQYPIVITRQYSVDYSVLSRLLRVLVLFEFRTISSTHTRFHSDPEYSDEYSSKFFGF